MTSSTCVLYGPEDIVAHLVQDSKAVGTRLLPEDIQFLPTLLSFPPKIFVSPNLPWNTQSIHLKFFSSILWTIEAKEVLSNALSIFKKAAESSSLFLQLFSAYSVTKRKAVFVDIPVLYVYSSRCSDLLANATPLSCL